MNKSIDWLLMGHPSRYEGTKKENENGENIDFASYMDLLYIFLINMNKFKTNPWDIHKKIKIINAWAL